MSRYISKMPPEIRELAEKRRSEQNPESKEDYLDDFECFDWVKTPEGYGFWESMYEENYSVFYEKYPQKDKLDELIEWMEFEFKSISKSDGNLTVLNTYTTILNKAKEIKGK